MLTAVHAFDGATAQPWAQHRGLVVTRVAPAQSTRRTRASEIAVGAAFAVAYGYRRGGWKLASIADEHLVDERRAGAWLRGEERLPVGDARRMPADVAARFLDALPGEERDVYAMALAGAERQRFSVGLPHRLHTLGVQQSTAFLRAPTSPSRWTPPTTLPHSPHA